MQFKKTILKNGVRIMTVPMKGNSTTTVMVLVEAGSNYESKENNGISHFLEHMFFKGTLNRKDAKTINTELDALGSQSNAFTGNEYTGYWAKAHHSKTSQMLDIVSDIYLNSTLPAEEIKKEKGVIVEEIHMYEDLPQRKVWEVFEGLLYEGQAPGRTILGPEENIMKFTQKDFIEYREKNYVSDATLVVVAGAMNENKVIKEVEKIFGKMPKKKKTTKLSVHEKQSAQKIRVHFKETDQTHLVLGWRSFSRRDKRNITLAVLSTILGGGMSSRLFQKMREELGICYYVRSNKESYTTHGYFAISAGVSNSRIGEALQGICEEVVRIRDHKVTVEELQKAKDYMVGNMYLGLESSDSRADFYGFQEILRDSTIKTPEDVVQKIQKVTVADIAKLAQTLFKRETMNLAVIGPHKDIKSLEKSLSL